MSGSKFLKTLASLGAGVSMLAGNAMADGIFKLIDLNHNQASEYRLNDHNQVSLTNNGYMSYWQNGQITSLGRAGGGYGLNNSGRFIGVYNNNNNVLSSELVSSTGVLQDFYPGTSVYNFPWAVDNSDAANSTIKPKVVGEKQNWARDQSQPYLFDGTTVRTFTNSTGLPLCYGKDINTSYSNSLIVAESTGGTAQAKSYLSFGINGLSNAVRLTNAGNWPVIHGQALNNRNSVAGSGRQTSTGNYRAFRWDYAGGVGTYNDMHPATIGSYLYGTQWTQYTSSDSEALALNDDNVAGGWIYLPSANTTQAAFWGADKTAFLLCDNVQSLGAFTSLTEVVDINQSGDLLGTGSKSGSGGAYLALLRYRMPNQLCVHYNATLPIYGDRAKVKNVDGNYWEVYSERIWQIDYGSTNTEYDFYGIPAASISGFTINFNGKCTRDLTLAFNLYNWNTEMWEQVSSSAYTANTAKSTAISVAPANFSKYINANGQVNYSVTGNRMPNSDFILYVDQVQMTVN